MEGCELYAATESDAKVVDDPFLAPNFGSDHTKMKKEMKRRRSSLGYRLTGNSNLQKISLQEDPPVPHKDPRTSKEGFLMECIKESLKGTNLSPRCSEKLQSLLTSDCNSWINDAANQKDSKSTGTKVPLQQKSPHVKFYEEKTQQLRNEYDEWRNLLHQRRAESRLASRKLKEFINGDTKIDEVSLKELSKEQQSILLTRPNYGQYLQEIKEAKEKLTMLDLSLRRNHQVMQHYLMQQQVATYHCDKIIEEEMEVQTPIKDLLRFLCLHNQCLE